MKLAPGMDMTELNRAQEELKIVKKNYQIIRPKRRLETSTKVKKPKLN